MAAISISSTTLPHCISYATFTDLTYEEEQFTAIGGLSALIIDEETSLTPHLDKDLKRTLSLGNIVISTPQQLASTLVRSPKIANKIKAGDQSALNEIAKAIAFVCFGVEHHVIEQSASLAGKKNKEQAESLESQSIVFTTMDAGFTPHSICFSLNGDSTVAEIIRS